MTQDDFFLADVLGGMVPILLIAWLLSWVFRVAKADIRGGALSVAAATAIGLLIRGFADGEGGFEIRLATMFSFSEAPPVLASGVCALILVTLWRLGRLRTQKDAEPPSG